MVDKVSKEIRSKTMRAVKSKETKLESIFRKALWQKGVRYRKNVNNLFGKPDIAIKKAKLVIFIDSCFWHGCAEHCRLPSSNYEYWTSKIERNKKRDNEVNEFYSSKGWRVMRFWEHQLKKSDGLEAAIGDIINYLEIKTNKYSP